MKVFELSGIKEGKNELGRTRKPHPHMLRDTSAVWHLRHGSRLHVVSKMVGHAKTSTTEDTPQLSSCPTQSGGSVSQGLAVCVSQQEETRN